MKTTGTLLLLILLMARAQAFDFGNVSQVAGVNGNEDNNNNVWHVDGLNGNDDNNCRSPRTACKTIGHAISLASSDDFIMVGAATYTENLSIGLSLTVIGSEASTTLIDGGGVGRVLTINSQNAQVTLSNLSFQNGVAPGITGLGGGIFNIGTLTINDCTISNNKRVGFGGFGAGIYSTGSLTINRSTISQNVGGLGGGGISSSGSVTINKSTLTANHAGLGGGVENKGTLTIINSTLSANTALIGGGIHNNGTLVITNSTVSGNTAIDGNGGGITNNGTLAIFNATFSGNSAVKGGGAGQGGAIFNLNGATATLQNSIVANSTNGGNCSGVITSHGYNLSSDDTCNLSMAGDLNDIDPRLGSLQNNGGPTQTMALQIGSPAIDSGNPSGCTNASGHLLKTDQRGEPRPDKEDIGGCDRGAYERQTD